MEIIKVLVGIVDMILIVLLAYYCTGDRKEIRYIYIFMILTLAFNLMMIGVR